VSWPALALRLTRALPASAAVGLSRILVLCYLALRPDYRREIRVNYRLICGRDAPWFWVRNAWRVGRNLGLMAGVGRGRARELVDNAVIRKDNGAVRVMEHDLHRVMASFHYGAWEFLPLVFEHQGQPVRVATSVQRDPELAEALDRLRAEAGTGQVRSGRELLEQASSPGLTGFMLDNTSRGNALRAAADGLEVRMPGTGFGLAERLGTQVVPAFCTVTRNGLEVRVRAPGGPEAAVRALLDEVRACPEEWVFWAKGGALSRLEAA
jgi:lauroyl/myristoyl acyltransferase